MTLWNQIAISGHVVRSYTNDSGTFAAATVKCLSPAGTVYLDLVAFDEPLIGQMSELSEGTFVQAIASPQARKHEEDGQPTRWTLRFVVHQLEVAQQSLLALASA